MPDPVRILTVMRRGRDMCLRLLTRSRPGPAAADRPHSGLAVVTAKTRLPPGAICVLTHVDVFPTFKDQAVELVKTQAEAARKDPGNLRYDVLQWDGHPNHFTLVEVCLLYTSPSPRD